MAIITTLSGVTSTAGTRIGGPLPAANTELFNAFFGVDAGTSINRSPNGSAWTAIGSGPSYDATRGRMTPATAAVRTAITNTGNAWTIMGVFRRVTGGSGAAARIIACNPNSIILWTINPTTGQMSLSGAQLATTATLTVAGDLDEYRFFAATTGGGVDQVIYNRTDDTASTDGTDGLVSGNGVNTIDLTGGASGSGNTRSIDWAWCRISTGISDLTEINAYYAWVQGVLLNIRGITC